MFFLIQLVIFNEKGYNPLPSALWKKSAILDEMDLWMTPNYRPVTFQYI